MLPGWAEISALSLGGTVTTTAAHRGLGSPFAAANWLATAVSREIADLGTATLPDGCGDEQLAKLSIAMSGSVTTRTRDRFASLIVHATFELVTVCKLGRPGASAGRNAMEYAQIAPKSASRMAGCRPVLFAVLAAIAMTLGTAACGPAHRHPKKNPCPPSQGGGY
jgi:hypothetical protein